MGKIQPECLTTSPNLEHIMSKISIPGSERQVMRGAKSLGPSRPDERFEVTVRLKRKTALSAHALDGTRRPRTRTYLTHNQLETLHGADPALTAKVEAFAKTAGLVVVESSPARRNMKLSGTVAAYEKAFDVKL